MLYTVATPIGNLKDVTHRALEVFVEVDVVLCEDTRQTKKLMGHYDLSPKLESFHAHTSPAKRASVVERLVAGETMALVSDAGTPGISDPGTVLVREAVAAGVEVQHIPGPSAFLTALAASGLPTHEFWYVGYLPAKKGRQTLFARFAEEDKTIVCYESKHRLLKTLESWVEVMPERLIVIAKELTKMHEAILRGTAKEMLDFLHEEPALQKGEFVLLVAPKGYSIS